VQDGVHVVGVGALPEQQQVGQQAPQQTLQLQVQRAHGRVVVRVRRRLGTQRRTCLRASGHKVHAFHAYSTRQCACDRSPTWTTSISLWSLRTSSRQGCMLLVSSSSLCPCPPCPISATVA
jgi:hypothetical protein